MSDSLQQLIETEVGERLLHNQTAYGKAWTGEDEDTSFLCSGVADKVRVQLADQIAELHGMSAPQIAELVRSGALGKTEYLAGQRVSAWDPKIYRRVLGTVVIARGGGKVLVRLDDGDEAEIAASELRTEASA